jgi:hypothetical protein
VSKAIANGDLKRLYHESRSFLKLRAERNKLVRETRSQKAAEGSTAGARA